jgi:hypothetical protein
MKKLILHIGAHKTGTTAIQIFLRQQSDTLAERGWGLVAVNGVLNLGNCISFARVGARARFGFRPELYANLIRTLLQADQNCIISSEDFFFINDDEWIGRLSSDIRAVFSQVTIIVYLRNQVDMAISNKAQGAKTPQSSLIFGNSEAILPELTHDVFEYLDYYEKLTLWRSKFPDCQLVVREYDRQKLINKDAICDFAEAAALGIVPQEPVTANETTGSKLTALLHKLRRAGTSPEMILDFFRHGHFVDAGGLKNAPAREAACEFFATFSESNRLLKDVYGVDLTFDKSAYPEHETKQDSDLGYEVESLVNIVARISRNWDVELVDGLRDAALALESSHPHLSYRLLTFARRLRPSGEFIQKKIAELERRLRLKGWT